jgi:hypothetical protein
MKIDFTGKVALVTASRAALVLPLPKGWPKAVQK